MAESTQDRGYFVDLDEMTPCVGCGCCFTSCFMKSPDCFGCASENTCCCIKSTNITCKQGRREGVRCLCSATECICTDFRCLIKNINQCLCSDSRCGFPTDDDVPLLLNLCFITMYYKDRFTFAFCKKFSELNR